MSFRIISLSLALLSPAALLACGSASEGGLSTARKALECQTNSDCGADAECSVEGSGSFCKLHDSTSEHDVASSVDTSGAPTASCASDADCGAGLECELEHGASYCKPHGGGSDDDGAASGGAGGSDDGSAGSSAAGGTTSGVAPGGAPACVSDADCGAGLECELEHGVSYCKPHSGGSDDGSAGAGGDDAGAAGAAGAPTSAGCTSDADCGAGLECENEHGVSYCKAHGGGNSGNGRGGDD